ncbi:hypothetical protein ANCCAN_01866 [Ancylostoma caninum]|uniref:Uncharacterized protein n=1 Tax=Ancylostoma caninum TaxID=29170 RepID=A0A368H8P1_ANCCA|nr:hypothetical protein ANCCAN_01866 [Ancylostoma caninum]
MLSVMPSRYALVTLGNYTLRTRLRTKFATQIINGVYRDDVYNPLLVAVPKRKHKGHITNKNYRNYLGGMLEVLNQ